MNFVISNVNVYRNNSFDKCTVFVENGIVSAISSDFTGGFEAKVINGGDLYLFVSKEGMDCADATQMTKEQAVEYLHSVLSLFDENDAVPLSTSLYRYDAKTESVVIVERMA